MNTTSEWKKAIVTTKWFNSLSKANQYMCLCSISVEIETARAGTAAEISAGKNRESQNTPK